MTRPVILAILVAIPAAGATQQTRWEFGATVGGGPSLVTEALGGVPDRQLYVTTVFARHPLVRWKAFEASYVGAVLPVVVSTGVPRGPIGWFVPLSSWGAVPGTQTPFSRGLDWGAGLAPVGLQLSAQPLEATCFFVEAAGGGVAFGRAMPDGFARSLNFLGSAGGGVRVRKPGHRAFVAGYRFTHLSNANTARENRGFNAHVFYLGLTLR